MKFNKVYLIRSGYLFLAVFLFYLLYLTVSSNAQVQDEHRLALPIVWFNSSGSEADPPTGEEGTPTPEPTAIGTEFPPEPTVDPLATATPTIDPAATATPTMPALGPIVFETPQITETAQTAEGLSVAWSGCEQATSFRLLFGTEGSRPESIETLEPTVTLGPLASGTYQLWVECYDEMGNSAFTPPVTVEVG